MQKTAITRGVKELLKGELPEVTLRAIRKIEEGYRPSGRMLKGFHKGTERMLTRTKTKTLHGAPMSAYNPSTNEVMLKSFPEIYPMAGWSGSRVRELAKNLTPEEREWVQALTKRHEAYEASSFASAKGGEVAESLLWQPVISKGGFTHGFPFGQHFGPQVLLRESKDVTRVGGPAAEIFRGARKSTHEAEVLRRAGVEYGKKNPLRHGKAARQLRVEQLKTTDEIPVWTSRYGGIRITPTHAAMGAVGLAGLPAAIVGGQALLRRRRQRKEASFNDVEFAGFMNAMRKWAQKGATTEKFVSAVPGAGLGAWGGYRIGKQIGTGRLGLAASILGGTLLGGTGTAVGYTKYKKLKSRFTPHPWETVKQGTELRTVRIVPHDGEPVTLRLEVAADDESKRKGLMFREELDGEIPGQGMLFPFDQPAVRSFWMRNVKFPLDMLFVNDGKVVKVIDSVEPGSGEPRSSDVPVTDVIEVAGGFCRRHGIGPGARVTDG